MAHIARGEPGIAPCPCVAVTQASDCSERVNSAINAANTKLLAYIAALRIMAPMLRKELVAASAEPLILALLSQGESYGYAIIQEIMSRSQHQIEWTDGML